MVQGLSQKLEILLKSKTKAKRLEACSSAKELAYQA
jgi:hypothetical protein